MYKYLRATILLALFSVITARTWAVSLTESHTNEICHGGSNASITITVSSGTAPYTFNWNDGPTTQNRSNVFAGVYSVTVTDNLGATASIGLTVTEPAGMNFTKSITNVTCGGGNDGAIDLTVTGGNPGYTYLWSDGITTQDRANIIAQNYYFTVTDAIGCTKNDSANVTQPPGVGITKVITDATCGASWNGAIDITVQFGNPGYTYLWNDGATTEDRTNLAPGNYSITVTDTIGCSGTGSATVNQALSSMSINTTSTQPLCFGSSDGTITIISVVGSPGPFTYRWNDGILTQNRTNLSSATYTVTVTSGTGCTASTSVNLSQPSSITITLTPIAATCASSNNGAINTTVIGGTPGYTYNWGGAVITKNRTMLAPGSYTITTTDTHGCTATATTTVTAPAPVSVTATPTAVTCAGGATGSVTTSVTGGTTPYSYFWNGGFTTANRINVIAGTYNVTVTDANGCSGSASAVIAGYTPMTLTTTQNNITCYGKSTGTATVNISNGQPGFSYLWSNGDVAATADTLSAATYTVTVTDNHACTATKSVTITQPSFPITINSTITDVLCYGNSTGAISTSVANGVSPYSYLWADGPLTQNRSNLTAGNYTVSITDNSGCTANSTFTVNQSPQLTISLFTVNEKCFGDTIGSIAPIITGGFAPFNYVWNDGTTQKNRSNLAAGTYSVTATDNHACSISASATITQPSNAILTTSVTNVACNGGSTGAINLAVSGGTTPYTFRWNNNSTSQNRTNLTAGSYNVTVTDSAACAYIASATVNQPNALTITAALSNVSCNGAGDGSITLTITGGTSPYTFNWNGGTITQNRSGLSPGSYSVTVTDTMNCSATKTNTITQPSVLNASLAVTPVTCFGAANGTINTTVTGGVSPFSFDWGGGIISQNRAGLDTGTYNVTIRDANNCSVIKTASITQPQVLAITSAITNPLCSGSADGSIRLTVTGGNTPFTFDWGGGIATQNISGVAAGTYQVTVTDRKGCTQTKSSTLVAPQALNLTYSVTNVTCGGGSDGTISTTPTGGTSAYRFSWSNGYTTQNQTGLPAGNYSVTLSDAHNCNYSTSMQVNDGNAINLNTTKTDVSCHGFSDGSINLSPTGGASPYTYSWDNGNSTQNLAGLTQGNYNVVVTDAGGCTVASSININEPAQLVVSIDSISNPICPGMTNGSINMSASGGSGSYTFVWNNGSNGPVLSGVGAGNYRVSVTDATGCSSQTNVNITYPMPMSVLSSKVNVSCYGGNNGYITCNATGGNGGYRFHWASGIDSNYIGNLIAGTYNVTVTDVRSCTASATVNITQASALQISEIHANAGCGGASTGSINLTINGGIPAYSYLWSNGAVTQNISNLAAGNYIVTVKDANLCVATDSITITSSNAMTINASSTDYACVNKKGSIVVGVQGGTTPYSYFWSNGSSGPSANNLNAGNYTITITDAGNCSATTSVTINTLSPMTPSLTTKDASCYGGTDGSVTLQLNGGSAPYSFAWSNGATSHDISNVNAGNYDLVITDANSCTIQATATIAQGPQIQVTPTIVPPTCFGTSDGNITTAINGGTPPYAFKWNNNTTAQTVNNLAAGTYSITVTDSRNCSASVGSIMVTAPQQISVSSFVTPVGCSGHNDGEIHLNTSGGSQPFTYSWNNGANSDDLTNLAVGDYQVTVLDSHNCTAVQDITVGTLSPVTLAQTVQNAACKSSQNGSVNLSISGGAQPYSFAWSNGLHTQDLSNVPEGQYQVTVTDSRNCSAQASVSIGYDYELTVHATSSNNTSTNGQVIMLNATTNVDHGNVFSWTPNSVICNNCSSTQVMVQETTFYTVNVIDANGCVATDTLTVEVHPIGQIFMPNAFTPNQDGNNDELMLYGDIGNIYFLEIAIFNRWGEKVFESNDHQFRWDGIYKGEAAQQGTYVYIMKITMIDGKTRDYKGSITLLR